MARIVNGTLMASAGDRAQLSATDRRRAERRLAKMTESNPLRRVRLDCHGWVRDPAAQVGDWLFCGHADCADLRRVMEVAE